MKTSPLIKGLAASLIGLLCVSAVQAEPLRIFAAASLQGALDSVAEMWAGDTVISYAGSGTIARQISLGAPADVVFLASPDWMAWLDEKGHLHGAAQDIMGNRLVLIGAADAEPISEPSADSLLGHLDGGRLAMGQNQGVPAGAYARAWLSHIGAWDALRPHLAETENVRAALALVTRREAPLGLVYATDAIASPSVRVLYAIPQDGHPAIRYPAAAITAAGSPFVAFLSQNRAAFSAAGFAEVR